MKIRRGNKNNCNFTLDIKKNGKVVSHTGTHKPMRITHIIRQIRTKINDKMSYHLKVTYGKQLDNFGKLVSFENEGTYPTKKDLLLAFMAFKEA